VFPLREIQKVKNDSGSEVTMLLSMMTLKMLMLFN
jgi:hypothetical protein